MISSTLLRLSAPLLRLLPLTMAARISHKFFMSRSAEFGEKFESAPLRFAPHVLMKLKIADAVHSPIAFVGVYEQELSRKLWDLACTHGGTLLDVGANYGYFSLLWCAARPENRAVAVEASPRNLAGLRHNIEANRFCERIEVLPWAASDHEGAVSFDLGPPDQTGWGGITHEPSAHAVTVPCHRLDQHVGGRTFTALKIDCEGSDALVIKGAQELLAAGSIAHVFFEENIPRMAELGLSRGTSQANLEKHGFRIEALGLAGSNDYHAWLKNLSS